MQTLAETLDISCLYKTCQKFYIIYTIKYFYRNRENLKMDNVSPLHTRYNVPIFYKYIFL